MKKVLSVFAALFLLISTSSVNANQELLKDVESSEIVAVSKCSLYATYAGLYVEIAGGNFYLAYFAAYSYCLENIDPIEP